MRSLELFSTILVCLFVLTSCEQPAGPAPAPVADKNRKPEVDAAVADVDFSKKTYQVELDTTMGKILLDLTPEVAPEHCKNFIGLAKIGFYNGLIFHRVIPGFMIQGGCPRGTGQGGPGYTIKQEFNRTLHEPGTLSMARTPDPNSAGSQFFICVARTARLDNQYTAFGKTANPEGLKVAQAISEVPTAPGDRPYSEVKIMSAKVIEKEKQAETSQAKPSEATGKKPE